MEVSDFFRRLSFRENGVREAEQYFAGIFRNIDEVDEYGLTLLHHAIENYNFELLVFLLENNSSVSIRDTDGKSAIDYAKYSKFPNCYIGLLES